MDIVARGVLIAGVGTVTWPRRREPGGFSFMVLLFALAARAGGARFEQRVPTEAWRRAG